MLVPTARTGMDWTGLDSMELSCVCVAFPHGLERIFLVCGLLMLLLLLFTCISNVQTIKFSREIFMDGQMIGQTNRQTDGQERWMNEWMDGSIVGWITFLPSFFLSFVLKQKAEGVGKRKKEKGNEPNQIKSNQITSHS